MVEASPTKSILPLSSSKRNSLLAPFSRRKIKSTPSASHMVMDLKVPLLVGVLPSYLARLAVVTERSLASVAGIPPMCSTQLHVLVRRVTSTELKPTSKYSSLVQLRTTPFCALISTAQTRESTQWEDGSITVLSVVTSS